MNLSDMFVSNPVKGQPVVEDLILEGSFCCQQCGHETESANMREGKIRWVCTECNFRSVVNGFG